MDTSSGAGRSGQLHPAHLALHDHFPSSTETFDCRRTGGENEAETVHYRQFSWIGHQSDRLVAARRRSRPWTFSWE